MDKNTGARIRAWRNAKGITQRDLAKRCGVWPATFSRLEAGTQPLKVKHVQDVCSAIGITMAEFWADTIVVNIGEEVPADGSGQG